MKTRVDVNDPIKAPAALEAARHTVAAEQGVAVENVVHVDTETEHIPPKEKVGWLPAVREKWRFTFTLDVKN